MEYKEDDYLMLSGIQHFAFCRRQWALIHVEQQWQENYQTTSGNLFHKRAHNESLVEKRGNTVIARGLRIASVSLGLSGQCDVVEFHRCDENGITLDHYEGRWKVYPIEYKRGAPKDGEEDLLQLCAQAICLEEMFLTNIGAGALFYGETKRRLEVEFSEQLRESVCKAVEEMHYLYNRGYTPKVKTSRKCTGCSLKNLCLPKIQKGKNASIYIENSLGEFT